MVGVGFPTFLHPPPPIDQHDLLPFAHHVPGMGVDVEPPRSFAFVQGLAHLVKIVRRFVLMITRS